MAHNPIDKIHALDAIEKEIITCMQSAGQSFQELGKEKTSQKAVETHTQQFLKSLNLIETKLLEQINYLTQVSTSQAHEGSGYASAKVLQMAWHRIQHARSRIRELDDSKSKYMQAIQRQQTRQIFPSNNHNVPSPPPSGKMGGKNISMSVPLKSSPSPAPPQAMSPSVLALSPAQSLPAAPAAAASPIQTACLSPSVNTPATTPIAMSPSPSGIASPAAIGPSSVPSAIVAASPSSMGVMSPSVNTPAAMSPSQSNTASPATIGPPSASFSVPAASPSPIGIGSPSVNTPATTPAAMSPSPSNIASPAPMGPPSVSSIAAAASPAGMGPAVGAMSPSVPTPIASSPIPTPPSNFMPPTATSAMDTSEPPQQ